MIFSLLLYEIDDTVGAEIDAESALDADHRLVGLTVPVYGAHDAGLGTAAAPDALLLPKAYAPAFLRHQGSRGTGPGARGILACPADNHYESPLHAAVGPDTDAGLGQARLVQSPGAGEHAALAPDAALLIDNCQSFHLRVPFFRSFRGDNNNQKGNGQQFQRSKPDICYLLWTFLGTGEDRMIGYKSGV